MLLPVRGQSVSVCFLLVLFLGLAPGSIVAAQSDEATAARFAELALDCVHREYPNKIAHVLNDDADALPPRLLTPAFYGCFDWHSSVHGHWLLARLSRLYPDADFAASARAALAQSLTVSSIVAEARYLQAPGRAGFERPYGLAWLLQLAAELREWDDPDARSWLTALSPLEELAAIQIKAWLPKLSHPIRVGEHSQTAFAFGLIVDWARVAGDDEMLDLLDERITTYYAEDINCPLAYEPSGQDFLSPCLAEADLMRRILEPERFRVFLRALLPTIPTTQHTWIEPAVVTDATDGKLAHLDGLNLSRAWMLDGILSALPEDDPRRPALEATAAAHREAGLASVTGDHYEGGHWLGTFATYLVTERGLQ